MSSKDYDKKLRNVSLQATTFLCGSIVIIVIMFIFTKLNNVVYSKILVLVLISILNIIIGTYAINCMVTGDCHVFSWMWTVFGLVAMFSLFITVIR